MNDIAKCTDHECPARFDCLRWNLYIDYIELSNWGYHADFKHNKLFGSCDYFVRLPRKKSNGE